MNLVSLLLQRFKSGVDLLVPVATRVFDLLSQPVIGHVDVRVIAWPVHVRHVQPNFTFDVLHRLFDARRKLLRAEYTRISAEIKADRLLTRDTLNAP